MYIHPLMRQECRQLAAFRLVLRAACKSGSFSENSAATFCRYSRTIILRRFQWSC